MRTAKLCGFEHINRVLKSRLLHLQFHLHFGEIDVRVALEEPAAAEDFVGNDAAQQQQRQLGEQQRRRR